MSEEAKAGGVEGVVEILAEGATLAGALLPQYRVYLLLGAAVARQFPRLYEDVVRLLEKGEPTAAEKAELRRKLEALAKPEGILP